MSIYTADRRKQVLVEKRYQEHLAGLQKLLILPTEGLMLDLGAIPVYPPGLKDALFKWILKGNEERLLNGEDIIVSKTLVLSCPIWKLTPPPLRSVPLTKDALLKPFKVQPVINSGKGPATITKKR